MEAPEIKSCIETMLHDKGSIPLLEKHLHRLGRTVKEMCDMELETRSVTASLERLLSSVPEETGIIRIECSLQPYVPELSYTQRPYIPYTRPVIAGFAREVVLPVFGRSWIKRGNREPYLQALEEARQKGWDDVILLNEKGQVCEGAVSNIFIRIGGEWHTPSLSEGCVAGVYREILTAEFREQGFAVLERAISPDEVPYADEILMCNAVRKAYPVTLTS